MSKPDQYDGFCRIPLSQELQETLRAADQSPVTISHLTKLNLKDADVRRLPWEETPKKAAGLKVIQELLSHLQDWPGKEKLPKNWNGKDLVLFKNAVLTEENERSLCVPRPFPAVQDPKVDVKAIIHNKKTGSSKIFSWEESCAFMLDEHVRVIAMNAPIRFFLLRIFIPPQSESPCQEENEQDQG